MANNMIINSGVINGNVIQKSAAGTPLTAEKESQKTGGGISSKYKYDVGISYASEQERYVTRVAKILEKENLRVFFAPNREEEFLGRDMITEFYDIYRYESMFVACFVSRDYLDKDITMHEAKTAMLREKEEKRNCLIPVYFGGSRLKELDPDIHFLDADRLREVEVAEKIKIIIHSFEKGNR